MLCPLCQKRPTKRACPALHRDICAPCCATKRLVEIPCPEDCRYLESAQKHPAAVVKRQIDKDVAVLMASMGRLTEQQLQLFFVFQSVVLGFKPDGLARVLDIDVAQATGSLAQSLETASRGLIYNEATASAIAEGLRKDLRQVVDEVTKKGGARAEREIAAVLRGIERGARHEGGLLDDQPTSYLDLVGRVLQQGVPSRGQTPKVIL
jgi:hypothetical protein